MTVETQPITPLTAADVLALAWIVEAVRGGVTVRRVVENREYEGTLRGIGTTEAGQSERGSDLRTQHVRVTLTSGTDVYWGVNELMHARTEGLIGTPWIGRLPAKSKGPVI